MKKETLALTAAIGMTLSVAGATQALAGAKGKVKCYGVAKKGGNDCGTSSHGCGGNKDFKDYDAKEWKYMGSKEECDAEKKKVALIHNAHGKK